jgi:hypothetical protein
MTSRDTPAPAARGGWRYQLGRLMFLVPFPAFVLAPIIVPLLGFDAGTTAAMIGGIIVCVEVVWFASIPLLGVAGFKQLKHGVFARLKPTDKPVGRTRHAIGDTMFLTALAGAAIGTVLAMSAFFVNDAGDYESTFLGLEFEQQLTAFVTIEAVMAAVLVASVYVLGLEFCSRLAHAFEWRPTS